MLTFQSQLPIGSNVRVAGTVPSGGAPAMTPEAAKPAVSPEPSLEVSYEPKLAAAVRHVLTLFGRLFGRKGDSAEEPTGGGGGTVTVQKGDSLSRIAQRTLGNAGRWRELYELNRDQIANPNLIHPGQVLKLPGGAAPAPAPAPAPSGSYTVQRGDTLSKIAQRALGSAGRWPEIFELNRDKIQNPNIVWPGLTLRLPGGVATPTPAAPSAPSGQLAWPVRGRNSSPFGMRKHPITGQHKLHTGMDIAAPSGTPVVAARGGRVTFAGWNGGYGNYVVIDHGNGLQTAYAHLSAINVRVGQQLNTGTQLGRVGSTGMSTGPHLHFEVKRNGQFVNPQGMLG